MLVRICIDARQNDLRFCGRAGLINDTQRPKVYVECRRTVREYRGVLAGTAPLGLFRRMFVPIPIMAMVPLAFGANFEVMIRRLSFGGSGRGAMCLSRHYRVGKAVVRERKIGRGRNDGEKPLHPSRR